MTCALLVGLCMQRRHEADANASALLHAKDRDDPEDWMQATG